MIVLHHWAIPPSDGEPTGKPPLHFSLSQMLKVLVSIKRICYVKIIECPFFIASLAHDRTTHERMSETIHPLFTKRTSH
jgi:hypothetical protein